MKKLSAVAVLFAMSLAADAGCVERNTMITVIDYTVIWTPVGSAVIPIGWHNEFVREIVCPPLAQ